MIVRGDALDDTAIAAAVVEAGYAAPAVRARARVAAFAAAVGVAFGAAALAGAALDPLRDAGGDGHGHATATAGAHGGGHATEAVAAALPGLAVSEGGYALAPEASTLPLGRPAELRFRILGPDGAAVTDIDVEHERRMHLIVVRRDLTGYQHLHPTLDATGTWSVRLRLPDRRGVPGLRRLPHRRSRR